MIIDALPHGNIIQSVRLNIAVFQETVDAGIQRCLLDLVFSLGDFGNGLGDLIAIGIFGKKGAENNRLVVASDDVAADGQ